MKTLLVLPPPGDPARPSLTLPTLAAYLRQAGIGSVEQMDLSLEAFLYLVDATRLERTAQRISERLARLEQSQDIWGPTVQEYARTSRATLIEPYVRERIDEALRVLRDPVEFYNPVFNGLFQNNKELTTFSICLTFARIMTICNDYR